MRSLIIGHDHYRDTERENFSEMLEILFSTFLDLRHICVS